jgi:hypothetical protein
MDGLSSRKWSLSEIGEEQSKVSASPLFAEENKTIY